MFKYIDIHSHLNFAVFDADREDVIKRTHDAGVAVITVGTQKDTSLKAVELAKNHDNLFACVGLHPIHTSKSFHDEDELGPSFAKVVEGKDEFTSRGEAFDTAIYRSMVINPKVVAIGECGLDYYRIMNNEYGIMEKQEEAFKKQIELAVEFDKPLMLHLRSGPGRSAYNDAFSILNSYFKIHSSKLRGNLHFFAGSWEEAKQFLDIGFTVSFTGVITFAGNYDEVIKKVPLNRIMAETDSPYVSPTPYRGKRNEPFNVREVYKAIAHIKNLTLEDVQSALNANASRFFRLV